MKKPMSRKRQAVHTLKFCIRQSRKVARQINRKLESLKQLNLIKSQAQKELIAIAEGK